MEPKILGLTGLQNNISDEQKYDWLTYGSPLNILRAALFEQE